MCGASAEREEGRLATAWWVTDLPVNSLCMPTTDLEPAATCPTSLASRCSLQREGTMWLAALGAGKSLGVPMVWRHQCCGPAAVSPDK